MSILTYDHNSNTFYLTGATATGITDINSLQMSIDLYPNPTKDELVIQLSDFPLQSNLKLNLFSINGQVIKQVSINSKLTNIELDKVSQGIYFYQLQDGHNTLKTGKIIVE